MGRGEKVRSPSPITRCIGKSNGSRGEGIVVELRSPRKVGACGEDAYGLWRIAYGKRGPFRVLPYAKCYAPYAGFEHWRDSGWRSRINDNLESPQRRRAGHTSAQQ